jgi:uncharacterized damage-inducible protein DinB
MRATLAATTVLLLGASSAAFAQNPISAGQKFLYNMVKTNIVRAAEKMPEENYGFKPTPEIRSFGQLLGHVADAQYMFCAPVMGKASPAPGVEKSKTKKAEIVAALKDAFTFCDAAYDGLTDADAATMVKFFGEQTKVTVLSFNTAHDNEHYGNIVTYMRLKGLVPPSSEPRK